MTSDALSRMAAAAVEDIIKDLSDRRGLKQEWNAIDEEIRSEIRQRWAHIIKAAVSGGGDDHAMPG